MSEMRHGVKENEIMFSFIYFVYFFTTPFIPILSEEGLGVVVDKRINRILAITLVSLRKPLLFLFIQLNASRNVILKLK